MEFNLLEALTYFNTAAVVSAVVSFVVYAIWRR